MQLSVQPPNITIKKIGATIPEWISFWSLLNPKMSESVYQFGEYDVTFSCRTTIVFSESWFLSSRGRYLTMSHVKPSIECPTWCVELLGQSHVSNPTSFFMFGWCPWWLFAVYRFFGFVQCYDFVLQFFDEIQRTLREFPLCRCDKLDGREMLLFSAIS